MRMYNNFKNHLFFFFFVKCILETIYNIIKFEEVVIILSGYFPFAQVSTLFNN